MTTIEIAKDRMKKFAKLKLYYGSHEPDGKMCAMEAAAWLAGEKHSDAPSCVSPILRAFLIKWNDDSDPEARQKLKPFLPRVIGTAGDGKDEMRGWLAADWVIRVHTPAWLELAGVTASAASLRALPPIRDLASLSAAQPSLAEARARSAAAWAAARDAARDAVWDAARDAVWDAAWAAARDAARAAARAAAWDAAWAAARDAAGAAAWDAARDAARDAADKKLAPTKVALQASALELLESMIDPKAE